MKKFFPKVLPVIHFLDRKTAFLEVEKAQEAGANGVFLISHRGDDSELISVASAIQACHPDMPIGINLLTHSGLEGVLLAKKYYLPMVWGDNLGVDSTGLSDEGISIQAQKITSGFGLDVFASVAFKYQSIEPHPAKAARNAFDAGFIPTTSGTGTGSAPDLSKIISMSEATGGVLAVASGMTPENVGGYAKYLSHILVATGIAQDEHRLDVNKLKNLIVQSKCFT